MKKGDNSPVRLSSLGFFSFSDFPFIFVSKSRKFIPTSLTTKTTTGAAPNTHKIFHSYRQRSKATQDGSKESLSFSGAHFEPKCITIITVSPTKRKKEKKKRNEEEICRKRERRQRLPVERRHCSPSSSPQCNEATGASTVVRLSIGHRYYLFKLLFSTRM